MAKAGQKGKEKAEKKSYAKVIRTAKRGKTGAYTFREEMVPLEKVQETLTKK